MIGSAFSKIISFCLVMLVMITVSFSLHARNAVQELYQRVNHGVVELHVKALSKPMPGQVIHKSSTNDSLGSGVIISKEGRILTAAHVVDRATAIEVEFANGMKTSGHVVWVDSIIDLAMIQAGDAPADIDPIPLAKKSDYQVGEQLIIIGAPFGVSHSLSVGYLSGVRDKEPVPGSTIVPRFLQTDASINMGNSGGPMFNFDGEVIGIVSHILSKSGGSNGLGFAVSIDTIHDVINSEPSNFSGFIPTILNEQLSKALNNPFGYGMLIQQVIPKTLADKLGFKGGHVSVVIGQTPLLLGGDILLSIDGHSLKDIKSIIKAKQRFSEYNKGDKIVFQFLREGVEKKVTWIVE